MAVNTRREFVIISAAGTTAALAPSQAAPAGFFSPTEASLVEIITGQIIPKDDTPGAIEAGVVHYIDRQLNGSLARFAPLYRESLKDFEPMRNMPAAAQTEYLASVEKGEHGAAAARLFQIMIDHTMQGFYGSPDHGGNQGEVSWKMLGIEKEMAGHSH